MKVVLPTEYLRVAVGPSELLARHAGAAVVLALLVALLCAAGRRSERAGVERIAGGGSEDGGSLLLSNEQDGRLGFKFRIGRDISEGLKSIHHLHRTDLLAVGALDPVLREGAQPRRSERAAAL
jgi:hypothetical protein